MSMPALISLRDELDEMLQCIRASRNIRTPMITCRNCGMTARAAPPHVSVLEKEWAMYRNASPDPRAAAAGVPNTGEKVVEP